MNGDFFVTTYSKKSRSFTLVTFAFFLFLVFVIFSLYWEVAMGIILLFALLLIFAFYPEFGLYSMIIFLPFIDWHFEFFSRFEVPFIDLLALLVILSFSFRSVYFLLFNREKLKLNFPLFFPFALFFLAVTVSNLFSENILSNIWYSVRWILLFYFAYIIFPINVIKEKRIFKNALICFCVSGLIISVMGFISLFMQDWQNEFIRVSPLGFFNIYPIGKNHNLIVEVLVVSLFFTMALKRCFSEETKRRLLDLLIIFQGLILIGTFSRAAWIALFLQAAVYLFYTRYVKDKSIKKVVLPIVISLIIIFPLVLYMFKLQGEYSIGTTSTESRMLSLEIALESFWQKPFLGHGSGQFVNLIGENVRFVAKYGEPLDSHGVWQKVLVENGIVGASAFVFFVLAISNLFIKKFRQYKKYYRALLPIILGVFGMAVIQFFNTSYYKGKMWLPVALVLASFSIIEINLAKKKHGEEKN